MAATTIGPKPATVNAEAAAWCPARHASSLRIVDGIRIPPKMFLGNRPVAAIRPNPTTIAPPTPNLIAPLTHVRLRHCSNERAGGEDPRFVYETQYAELRHRSGAQESRNVRGKAGGLGLGAGRDSGRALQLLEHGDMIGAQLGLSAADARRHYGRSTEAARR